MKRMIIVLALIILLVASFMLSIISAQQESNVSAEAIGQANLRAAADVNSDLVGEIVAGTSYRIIGRSEFYPWLLLGDPVTAEPIGWVFETLITIRGNVQAVPFSTLIINQLFTTPTLAVTTPVTDVILTPSPNPVQATPTATTSFAITGVVTGEINIRYGPGVEYPRIGVAQAGERYEIIGYHTQFPWLRIRYEEAPNGSGWIATDLLEVEGNVLEVAAISQTRFALPTLTPTPPQVQASSLLNGTEVPISTAFQILGNELWEIILDAGFDPETSRFGALFVLDLQTGEAITFGNNYAFSGTSINKIAILARLYQTLEAPPNADIATDIANTMICSENVATNRLLSIVGSGDQYDGADEVTEFLRLAGLERTFITAPFIIDPDNPQPPPRPIQLPETEADQQKSNPDPSNQLTVEDMGWLMGSIYQCAYQESGALMESFPGRYSSRECRQMLHVMSNNTVDALLKAGVPADTRVAHKHGWIPDTHGNAAVFFTPGGDYAMAIMVHQPDWLNFEESLPVIAEVSRAVYNHYNPTAPMPTIRDGFIPEANSCNFAGTPLIADLMSPVWEN